MAQEKHSFSLYERDHRVYDPPASYDYDPPITAKELEQQLESGGHNNDDSNGAVGF